VAVVLAAGRACKYQLSGAIIDQNMHLQQTKYASRATGGPQYYIQNLESAAKVWLRKQGVCRVFLDTPYGITPSPYLAVSKNHKLTHEGHAVIGRVGHDRIQQAGAFESIGDAIRRWYGLPERFDFNRIDMDLRLIQSAGIVIRPLVATDRSNHRKIKLCSSEAPLSLTTHYCPGISS
jgi:hypothetical protein